MSRRNVNWDLIRVAAVLAVVVGHITDLGPVLHPELSGYPFTFAPQFGAATLMVISAYFACVTIRRGRPGRWLRGRLARLLPAYLAVVVLLYAVGRLVAPSFDGPGIWPWPQWTPTDLVSNLTLTQGWRLDPVYLDNAHWTLPVQVAAFAGAALLWHRWRGVNAQWLATGLVLAPLVVLPLMLLPESVTEVLGVVYTGSGIGRAYLFGVGIALWLWGRGRLPAAWVLVLSAASVVQYGYSTDHELQSGACFGVMLGLIALAARGPDWAWLARARRPISWLAGISFGVYLVHQQLGFFLARALVDAGVGGWGRLLAVFAAAIAVGWLLTVAVERPAHRLLTRTRERPEPKLSVGAPSMESAG